MDASEEASPVYYLHDPLRSCTLNDLSFTSRPFPRIEQHQAEKTFWQAIPLYPSQPRIPFWSSIADVYESRSWRESLKASLWLVKLLAEDKRSEDFQARGGVTLHGLAVHELRPGFDDRFAKATGYMYPLCIDKRRLEIIAITMVMQFVFDDKGEEVDDAKLPLFLSDYLGRLNGDITGQSPDPLQKYIDDAVRDLEELDSQQGNGGAEVLAEMRKTFSAIRPATPPRTIGEYLKFRHVNICADSVFARVKFSLGSSVDLHSPTISRFLDFARDHLAIVNDLYSYEKEISARRDGSSQDLVNIVPVVQDVLSLPYEDASLEITFALLQQREKWMAQELDLLASDKRLDTSTWEFLRGIWICLAGNVVYSMTSARYGGASARNAAQSLVETCGVSTLGGILAKPVTSVVA